MSQNEAKAQELAERLIRGLAKRASSDVVAYDQTFEQDMLDLMARMPAHEYVGEFDPAQGGVTY